MSNPTMNRFEWLKAVLQAEGLTATAKNVASALAIQFANAETGKINPSQETVADYLKVHRDTVKRVLRELRNAGWLMTIGDGGRGKAPLMRLLTPGKIIPFRGGKRGTIDPAQAEKRGGDIQQKGGQIDPSHYKEEQSLEQKGECIPIERPTILKQFDKQLFEGNPYPGLRLIPKSDWASLNEWADWLQERGYPKLCHLPIRQKAEKRNTICFWLPSKTPPASHEACQEAERFVQTLIEGEANCYAAQ